MSSSMEMLHAPRSHTHSHITHSQTHGGSKRDPHLLHSSVSLDGIRQLVLQPVQLKSLLLFWKNRSLVSRSVEINQIVDSVSDHGEQSWWETPSKQSGCK